MPRYAIAVVYEIDAPDANTAWETLTSAHFSDEAMFASNPLELPADTEHGRDYLYEGTMPEITDERSSGVYVV